jgi:hypothetical protein
MRVEVLETVSDPSRILAGNHGELIAVRETGVDKFLVVPYRETGKGGFIITAFLTGRTGWMDRRIQVWPA